MYATGMTNAITPTSWFYFLYIQSQNETDSNSPSTLEVASLLSSHAPISKFNLPTIMMITQLFSVYNPDQHDISKTLILLINPQFQSNNIIM